MEDFIINAQTVSAGESKQIVLNSYELHTKTKIEIPVFESAPAAADKNTSVSKDSPLMM